MQVLDYETISFPVDLSFIRSQTDIDYKEILRSFIGNEGQLDVRYKVKDTDKLGKDIYSVMVNDNKIGTIEEADREIFEYNIQNATSADIQIHEAVDENQEITYQVDTILHVPYVVVEKDTQEVVKKREKAIIFAIGLLILNGVISIVRGQWISVILSLAGAGVIYYWAFIKKSGQIYDFIMKKERKIIDLF